MDNKDNPISWSEHFHKRLMERFGIILSPENKIEIEEMIHNEEIFCTIYNKTKNRPANVYGVFIDGHEVMVVYRVSSRTVITAYRLNWFRKEGDTWVKNFNNRYSSKRKDLPLSLKKKIKKRKGINIHLLKLKKEESFSMQEEF